jgi:hypothetical protein
LLFERNFEGFYRQGPTYFEEMELEGKNVVF